MKKREQIESELRSVIKGTKKNVFVWRPDEGLKGRDQGESLGHDLL